FDPTAYQRERQAKLQRLEEDRRRRERTEIGYSTARNSGRDSWIGSSRDRGSGPSLAGVAAIAPRGRTTMRDGGSSGYASAGSRASR
ncbi:unnamed protein product, partial [Ectocarpus sp. 12 AP-2014]